jgi:hypothetical protein
MLKKKWISLIFITAFVILVWVAMDIFGTKPSIEVSPDVLKAIASINPDFNKALVDKVASVYIPPQLSGNAPVVQITTTPSPSPTPLATASASASPSAGFDLPIRTSTTSGTNRIEF